MKSRGGGLKQGLNKFFRGGGSKNLLNFSSYLRKFQDSASKMLQNAFFLQNFTRGRGPGEVASI